MKENIQKVLDEFKENEKLINRPIREYKAVKSRYNKEALEEVKKESTKKIKDIRSNAVAKALGDIEELERQVRGQQVPKELSEQDLITLIYLIENTEDDKELEEIYRENRTNENFKKIFKAAAKKKDKSIIIDKVEAEEQPKELRELEKAKAMINAFGMDDKAYPIIDNEKMLNEKELGTLEYKNISDDLLA